MRQSAVLALFLCLCVATAHRQSKKPFRLRSPYSHKTCQEGPDSCSNTNYRTIDGSCNNLEHLGWGQPNRPYGRLLGYNYADGIHSLARTTSGKELPSARLISVKLFPPKDIIDPKYTLLTMQHGQFITHDQSLTADALQIGVKVQPVQCCTQGRLGKDASNTDRCAPIEIPKDDPFYGPLNVRCFDFTRTATSFLRGCSGPNEVRKPLSVVTAWLDLSLVYGSSDEVHKSIRAFEGGRLITVTREDQEWPPQQPNVTLSCPAAKSQEEPCYKSGDVRSNQNPGLTVLQNVWFREHNRVADFLQKLNPNWDDEKVFQESRRIVIAEFQHISYTEYLTIILGEENMVKKGLLYPNAKKCVNDYDKNIDPAVLDEHANGGAFRNFHSAIQGHLQLMSESRDVSGLARMSDWLNRPLIQEANSTFNMDSLTRGMTTQREQYVGRFMTEEITQFLFRGNRAFGIDLKAFDIQRARDHGIPTYVEQRKYCGLKIPESFEDLTNHCKIPRKLVKELKAIYENVDDIELLVGGGLEPLVPGTLSGETFLCILLKHFKNSRCGDRFFYQNCEDNAFTTEQLQTIQEASMSRILCDNGHKIKKMQPRAFEVIDEDNELTKCSNLPVVDLELWSDKNKKPKKNYGGWCFK